MRIHKNYKNTLRPKDDNTTMTQDAIDQMIMAQKDSASGIYDYEKRLYKWINCKGKIR